MPLLHPDLYLPRVTDLTARILRELGARAMILDMDNTLTLPGNPNLWPGVADWLCEMRGQKIKMMILSNNRPSRVGRLARELGLPFTAYAVKPLPGGFWRAAKSLGIPKKEIAVVGDQIFTDVLGGNLFGAITVLVRPIEPEKSLYFRVKRRLEKDILKGLETQEMPPRNDSVRKE